MKEFFKRIWQRRWIRVCAWFAFSIFTVLMLVRQYAGWSGSRRWAAVQRMLEREGESLDFRKIAPDPIPDENNFCAIPLLKDMTLIPEGEGEKSEPESRRLRLIRAAQPNSGKAPTNREESVAGVRPRVGMGPEHGQRVDLKAWADWFRKDDPQRANSGSTDSEAISGGLSRNDELVSELAAGLERPESQWTPPWKTRELPQNLFELTLPHYRVAQGLAQMLCARCALDARLGNSQKAHEAALICIRVNEANAMEPFLIGTLVTSSQSAMISGVVWELCDAHAGTAEDFQRLQDALTRLDLRRSALIGMRGELACGANVMAYVKRSRSIDLFEYYNAVEDPWKSYKTLGLRLLPGGWFDGNAAALAQGEFESSIKPLRDSGLKSAISAQNGMEEATIHKRQGLPWRYWDEVLALKVTPELMKTAAKLTYSQSLLNEAIAACALERYRVEHGEYPDTLEAANRAGEKPIPMDLISNQPMLYRKTSNGKYVLWCVGLDGKNDGGKRVLSKWNPENTRFWKKDYAGDWVWEYPED